MSKVQSGAYKRRSSSSLPGQIRSPYWLTAAVAIVVTGAVIYLLSTSFIGLGEPGGPTTLPVVATDAPMTPASAATSGAALTATVALSGTETALTTTLHLPLAAVPPAATITPTAQFYTYTIVHTYPHDPQAFTQGLVFDNDMLYEGTGLNGSSSLRRVDLATGEVLQQVDLADQYFGEGVTVFGERIYQLTWRSQTGFIYDKTTFTLQAAFSYPTEGWGLTQDGKRLIMSDGSSRLRFWEPDTLAEIGYVDVYDAGNPVTRLNELEYVQGEVFANIWQTDRIARIDPETGRVTGWIDLAGLLSPEERAAADVLNGIAYLPDEDRLFVTGKLWPKLFEIRLVLQDSSESGFAGFENAQD